MTENYFYNDNANFLLYDQHMKVSDINAFINSKKNIDYSNDVVEHILSSNIKGYLRSNGSFSPDNQEHINEIKTLVSNSIEYLNSKFYK